MSVKLVVGNPRQFLWHCLYMFVPAKSESLVRVRNDRVKRTMSLHEREETTRATLATAHPSPLHSRLAHSFFHFNLMQLETPNTSHSFLTDLFIPTLNSPV